MKRLAGFLLLVLYLCSSPGLVYSLHLCGELVTDVRLSGIGEPAGCCAKSAKPVKGMKKGCCHDQKVSSPLKDVKLAAQLKLLAPVALPAPPALRVVRQLAITYPADEPAPRPRITSGPPPPACPAYVRGHAFLL